MLVNCLQGHWKSYPKCLQTVGRLKALMKVLPVQCEALGLIAITSTIHLCLRRRALAGRLVSVIANFLGEKLGLGLMIGCLTLENAKTIQ